MAVIQLESMDISDFAYGQNGCNLMTFRQVVQMIHTEIVDLYQSLGLPKGAHREGHLQIWSHRTPARVSRCRRRPGVLILPGGGYDHVSEREGQAVALRFLARGYDAFVLDYAVAPARFPAALEEAAMAMAYLRSHAGELELDPRQIALVGFSAGGHLAGLLGTMYDSAVLAAFGPPEKLRPDALGLCYPVTVSGGKTHEGSFRNLCGGDGALREALSLEKLVRPELPPVYLWHTRDDASVPVWGTLRLALALEAAEVPFEMHIYPRGPHGLATADLEAYSCKNMPEASEDARNWPENMMKFLKNIGFEIKDTEEDTI